MDTILSKKEMSEEDVKLQYITPASGGGRFVSPTAWYWVKPSRSYSCIFSVRREPTSRRQFSFI